ncbi:MAG: Dihydrofolate reductase, partial [uncultured Gemmatimonadaceae bacterium]
GVHLPHAGRRDGGARGRARAPAHGLGGGLPGRGSGAAQVRRGARGRVAADRAGDLRVVRRGVAHLLGRVRRPDDRDAQARRVDHAARSRVEQHAGDRPGRLGGGAPAQAGGRRADHRPGQPHRGADADRRGARRRVPDRDLPGDPGQRAAALPRDPAPDGAAPGRHPRVRLRGGGAHVPPRARL